MDDIDDDENLCPRTFNNYRAFFIILWNWGYVSANPFTEVNKKPKKLTFQAKLDGSLNLDFIRNMAVG